MMGNCSIRKILWGTIVILTFWAMSPFSHTTFAQRMPSYLRDNIRVLLDTLPPLPHDVGNRELLYQYSVGDLSDLSEKEASWIVEELVKRGGGVITFWTTGDAFESRIEEGIRIARIQERLGLSAVVDATGLLYGFYDGTPATAHVDEDGKAFFDSSFAGRAMGCPFTLHDRVLVRRTDFTEYTEPITFEFDGKRIVIPSSSGECQVLMLE